MTKIDLFKKWEKIKISAPLWRRLYGFCWGGGTKTDPLFAKKHVLSPCLGTSPWVGWFCSKVHTKHNGSKSCIFATLVGKGLIGYMHVKVDYCFILSQNVVIFFIVQYDIACITEMSHIFIHNTWRLSIILKSPAMHGLAILMKN